MNTEKSVLYKLELKYPWRKLLRGIYILTVATWFLMFAIPAWAYYVWHSVSTCLLYTSPSPRDLSTSRMPSSA